ncbi:MAG: DNA polymerase III subunit beta [Planctomycetaceae bacterium]|jgi:DNA polymerase-3 subunit beta|nr:DNA polymerase III subunit beta [Planctomycetaceae bacterium]
MKFTTPRTQFSQIFQLTASVAATRDVKPVMQNVKVKTESAADAQQLVLMATDGEIGMRKSVTQCTIAESGEAIIPTKRMKLILQEATSENVDVSSDSQLMVIVCDSSRFQLTTQSTDEFPEVYPFEETAYHEVSTDVFRELVKRTAFATETESSRYALGGVLLEMLDNKIIGVATDGRRLACQEISASSIGGHLSEGTAIVPPRALSLVEKATADESPTIKINMSSNRMLANSQNTTLFTRLIEGRFPKWRNIMPDVSDRICVPLPVGGFYSAVRQAAIVTSEKQPGVIFQFSEGKLVLQAQGAEIGESVIEMPVAYQGQPCNVKLDPAYLIDFLRVLPSEKTIDVYVANDGPIVFKTDDDYTYILMPLT